MVDHEDAILIRTALGHLYAALDDLLAMRIVQAHRNAEAAITKLKKITLNPSKP